MNMSNIWKYDLRKGATDHPSNGACLFNAGMWLVYGKIGDNPPCSCPVIRSYAMGLNDRMDDTTRQLLKPFILRVVGNRDHEAESSRLRYLILETARRLVPFAFDGGWHELAADMRALPDGATYAQVETLMNRAASYAAIYAARAARAASDAARAASYAARAARDAALAASCAARAARAASDAARAASDAASDAAKIWNESIAILDGALRIGKQSPEFNETTVRASVTKFARAAEAIG